MSDEDATSNPGEGQPTPQEVTRVRGPSASSSPPRRFRLVLRDQGGPVPLEHRLRTLLKQALRRCGLRCESAEEVTAEQVPPLKEEDRGQG